MLNHKTTSLELVLQSILAAGLIVFSSCSHYGCDPAYVGPSKRSAEMLKYYSYPRQDVGAKVEKIKENRTYVIERVEFPSAINGPAAENIKIDYYAQKREGKFATVLILPIAGGIDFSVRGFANHFASNGFNCALVHSRKVHLEDAQTAEQVEDYFRQTVLDNKKALDYLVGREEVDANRLGCFGLSLGAIKASMLSAVDERLKCTVLGLAGGSIADVALLSREKKIRNYIKSLVDEGISPEAIHTELSAKVVTDPVKLAEYVDARNVLMYIAAFDRVVPRQCGDKLWEAIGKPEVIYLFSGHYSSFLYLPYAEMKSLSFFKKKFKMG